MEMSFEIYSIFGQMDAVIARQMVDEGKARMIAPSEIPFTASIDETTGARALFAILIPHKNMAEYERRVSDLRL
jgi:hypothetical protein